MKHRLFIFNSSAGTRDRTLLHFILSSGSFLLPIVALIVAVNYFGDASNLFSGVEREIAKHLLSGLNVKNVINLNERELQREIISQRDDTPETVVLGSSRMFQVGQDLLPNQCVFNYAVSGATIQDLIGIVRLVDKHNQLPRSIYIGVDPWMFNENNGQIRWYPLTDEVEDFLAIDQTVDYSGITKKVSRPKTWQTLLSVPYFQESLSVAAKKLAGRTQPVPTVKRRNKTMTRVSDGTICYAESYREASIAQIRRRVATYIQDGIYALERFDRIAPPLASAFRLLVEYLEKSGVQVKIVLVPYHPMVYSYIRTDHRYRMVNEVESYIKSISRELSIKMMGSYDPACVGNDESLFYDAMHLNEAGVRRLLEKPD